MSLLDGKVVLITGGARGQGRAHAIASAREGADVAVLDIANQVATVPYPMATPEDLTETVRHVEKHGRRALSIQADVRQQDELDEAVKTVLEEFGRIDCLVINHGIWAVGQELWNLSDEEWADMQDINVTGVWRTAKAVVPHMIERGSGSVVITASTNGFEPGIYYGHYSTSKHATVGLAKNLALELGRYGIRCNALAPGVIETPMIVNQVGMDLFNGGPGGTVESVQTAAAHYHALKGVRAIPAMNVADAGVWLNSDLAAGVTGVTVPVDAGHQLLAGYNHEPV
jgi:SDR family mycofactocin-dependent oxidoreductase